MNYECECIDCGAKINSDQHCNELKCEKCGGQMRRAERPGVGRNSAPEHKWMSSGFAHGAPTGEINADKGVIEGVSVCTVGEAKGHGVNLDSEFIEDVRAFGAEKKQGLKARYGHPNMSSTALGTFLGRFKNFTVDGDHVRADLFLSNEAKVTPQGDLHAYVIGMATNEPDMFGTSIVFTPGKEYVRGDDGEKVYDFYDTDEWGCRFAKKEYEDMPIYVECEELHGCDAVDEPAANEGLFSAFSKETIAGQVTEFLDLHPEFWKQLESNPAIVEVLAHHGDKMDGFFNRYRAYREHSKESKMDTKKAEADAAAKALKAKEAGEQKLKEEQDAAELAAKTEKEAAELAEKEAAEKAKHGADAPEVVLTAERDELKTLLGARSEDVERLTGELSVMTEQVTTLTTRAVDAETERDEAGRKLAAIEGAGAPPVSAEAASEVKELTPWQKAQKKK